MPKNNKIVHARQYLKQLKLKDLWKEIKSEKNYVETECQVKGVFKNAN